MAISSQCDSSIFLSTAAQAVPGSAEWTLLEECAGSTNERQTLKTTKASLLLKYYSTGEDEHKDAEKNKCSPLLRFSFQVLHFLLY